MRRLISHSHSHTLPRHSSTQPTTIALEEGQDSNSVGVFKSLGDRRLRPRGGLSLMPTKQKLSSPYYLSNRLF